MIRDQFRKEIKKGTGKALFLMKGNPDEDFSEALFHACVEHLDYDPQCSGGRGLYLYDMIQLMKDRGAFEERVIDKLLEPDLDYWSMCQLFEIVKWIAKSGNNRAREAMYKKYEQLCMDEGDIAGEYDIIALDGLEGLAFIAENHGKILVNNKDAWEDGYYIVYADEELKGQEDSIVFLERKAKDNKYIRAYLEAVEKHNEETRTRKKLVPPSYFEITERIHSEGDRHFYDARRMAVEDHERLALDFRRENDEKRLINYLKFFVQVKYPLDHRDILKVVNNKNDDVRSWAIFALGHFKGQDIRQLIENNFLLENNLWETFHLLRENYLPADAKYIERFLLKENDVFAFHSMGLSIEAVIQKNWDSGLVDSMVILYDRGYCANCRERLISAWLDKDKLPNWIAEEAIYDCNLDIRQRVRNYLEKNGQS